MTETEIANSALMKIGAKLVQSIDDGSVEGDACNARLHHCRRVVLRMHPWNCATARTTLAASDVVPAFGFDATFPFPADCLRVLRVDENTNDYRIEGRTILYDSDSIELVYIKDVTTIPELDVACAECVAAYLAWDICFKLTSDSQLRRECWTYFMELLRKARFVDSTEEPNRELKADLWINSRFDGNTIN